jgi:hypothetical protein
MVRDGGPNPNIKKKIKIRFLFLKSRQGASSATPQHFGTGI